MSGNVIILLISKMAQLHHTNFWNWKEKEYKFDIYLSEEFPPMDRIKQVYALVISKDKQNVLLVYNREGLWLLPGGTVEEGESVANTLIREVKEETNRDVQAESIQPFFYQEAFQKGEGGQWDSKGYQVRLLVFVDKDNEFESDPDNGDIIKAEWIPVKDIQKYIDWQETTTMISEHIGEYIQKMSEKIKS